MMHIDAAGVPHTNPSCDQFTKPEIGVIADNSTYLINVVHCGDCT